MEDKVEPLEELAAALDREFGRGAFGGMIIGIGIGVGGALLAGKVTDLIIRRWKVKEAKRNAKLSKSKD